MSFAEIAFGAGKPNVVIIMADDAAYSDFGFTAALRNIPTEIRTPNLDALAQQSVIGSQFYSAHSLCSPTRASMLTGQSSQRFGYENNLALTIESAGSQGLAPDQITIAQRLKPLGYTTGMIGKWHLGHEVGLNRPADKGFDEFYGFLGGGRSYFTQNTPANGIWKNDQFYESQYRVEGDQSRYDPVRGRYLTDALGEEAASFINRHADDESPFFLYMPLTGPHEPFEAKQSDLDLFSNIPLPANPNDPNRRAIAAMTYAVDRAVGDVLGALKANGIDDETIVIFTNDNGAASYVGNPPFRGHKGTSWEGGIRVPFLIKAPGLAPGVNNTIMTGLDLLPTIVTAAGGDVSGFALDGYDVMPNLTGAEVNDPNKVYIWRNNETWAVRKGDWKLTLAYIGAPGRWLHNIKQSPNENVYLQSQRPDIVAELARELTGWEAQMAKPKWGDLGVTNQNLFDHFVFRNNLAAVTNWSTANAWREGGTANIKTAKPADAYANGIFEFTTRDDDNYVATNNMNRMSGQTFMLNQMRLTGTFNGAAGRQGLINGKAVLFVKNLNGALPQIRLDATSSRGARFEFLVSNEIQLFNDLQITGNGTQDFVIGGNIRDYYEPEQPNFTTPHNVRKWGTSTVTLRGDNTFGGSLTVTTGKVVLAGPNASINGAASIVVQSNGEFSLQEGLVKTPTLNVHPNGLFAVNGGRLETKTVIGDLTVNAGTFAPGLSTAISTISDAFIHNGGNLQIDLGGVSPGTGFDQLQVGGTAAIAGGLQVQFAAGFTPALYQTFEILTAANVIGTFTNHSLPILPGGMAWSVLYTTHGITLTVRPPGQSNTVVPTGDYNLNGVVDAADYSVWRNSLGSTTNLDADGNGDLVVDDLDYDVWKSRMRQSFTGMAGDFNSDGSVDAADYSVWRDSLGSTTNLDADGNGDQIVDDLDYDVWKSHLGLFTGITGDFNGNGSVDAADYSVWRDGLGSTYTIDDFSVWRAAFQFAHFGVGAGAGAAAIGSVPESSCVIYLILGELVLEYSDIKRIAHRSLFKRRSLA